MLRQLNFHRRVSRASQILKMEIKLTPPEQRRISRKRDASTREIPKPTRRPGASLRRSSVASIMQICWYRTTTRQHDKKTRFTYRENMHAVEM